MQGPFQQQPPDPAAHAMQSAASTGEVSTIATSMLLSGLSGLLVSEGLARLVREVLGDTGEAKSEPPTDGTPSGDSGGEADQWGEIGAKALKDLVVQGVAGRILALNTVNTYLSLATAEQLRRIGTQLVTGAGGTLPDTAGAPLPHQAPPAHYGGPSLGAYTPITQTAPWPPGYQTSPGTVAPVQPPAFHPWAGRRPW